MLCIRLTGDGDVSAAIATTNPETGVDVPNGDWWCAPEGVEMQTAALKCLGGEIQGGASI